MTRDVGGRGATLKNGKQYSIVLDIKQRETIKAQKGDSSISEFVRECIDLRDIPKGGDSAGKTGVMQERILMLEKELKIHREREQKRIKITDNDKEELKKGYTHWASTTGLNNTQTRFAWAQGNTKGCSISPDEALIYLQVEGLITVDGLSNEKVGSQTRLGKIR